MALTINIELDDADLKHFRKLMRNAKQAATALEDEVIITSAEKLLARVSKAKVPAFIRDRIDQLEMMKNLAVDESFGLPAPMRRRVVSALAYFVDPEDMIADAHPALGFLDDAIMIELVARELEPELAAYRDFCVFRDREAQRRGVPVDTMTREKWQQSKRTELINRIQRRRAPTRSGRQRSPFSLW